MIAAPGAAAWPALGSTAAIRVSDAAALDAAREVVEAELAAIDLACSRFRDDSELIALNALAGRPVRVSPLLLEAVQAAVWAARASDGDVDLTIGRALALAGYDRDFGELVPSGTPLRATAVTGWRAIVVDREASTVRVPRGVEIDLGATAKALAADRAARAAAERTGGGVLVNLGGDIAVAGPPPAGGWLVRVCEDHRSTSDAEGQTVAILDGGLATSSTTVRRWRRGGDEAHHIIDPGSGLPAAEVWRTVSVAAATCVDANTASTAAIVRGHPASAWLEAAGLPARLVAADGSVVTTAGWPAEALAA